MWTSLSAAGRAAVVVAVALVVGFALFTALGVGGADDEASTTATAPSAPEQHVSAVQKYSEEVSVREGGSSTLSEDPPISPARFKGPIRAYLGYASGQASLLQSEATALGVAVRSGDRTAARDGWRIAFARYLRLGAVYGAFGSLDTAIDGQPGGLPRRTRDPRFSGLHRIELGLWSGVPVSSLTPVTDRLVRDVRRLRTAIPKADVSPSNYATRAHEILEDAQRDFLSGVDVPWSHEGVLATYSGLQATRVVIRTLRPLLGGRDSLDPVLLGLSRMGTTIASIRRDHAGHLPTLERLRNSEREKLNGSVSWALERLQRIPDSLATTDPVRIPAVPKP
jgi:iron uptake system EfeUOB component EfeO/EfeM